MTARGRRPSPQAVTADQLERYASRGLLDQMLQLRTFPDPAALLNDDVVVVWRLAIDAVLDVLVPALKGLAMVPAETAHGPLCINKRTVEQAIGRVPLSRNEQGWT